ncbi:VOC family protein [Agromyces sp. GXS1127]|uniref:VOC family protein n=1 Tax=Agromyces sp. GXS1127 TaxID=3424181 RepID=UPI003D323365
MGQDQRLGFLAADGLDGWRVAYCGPIARFATGSVRDGTAFATAVTALDALAQHPPLIDIRPDGVIVRLCADLIDLDDGAADRARAVTAIAREHGLTPEPHRTQDVQVAIATSRPVDEVLPFWRAALGYADHVGDDLVDPRGRGPSVWFQPLDPAKRLRHAMHLDLAVPREIATARLEAALGAGGRVASDAEVPQFWTCADAAGNKVDLVTWPDLPVQEDDPASPALLEVDRGGVGGTVGSVGAHAANEAGAMSEAGATAAPERLADAAPPAPARIAPLVTAGPAPLVAAGPAELARGEAMFGAFRAASDLDDWPVVFWGPTAWFDTGSLARSAALAAEFAGLDGADRLHLDLRADGLAVRLARDLTELVESDLDVAKEISAVSATFGARPDPSKVQVVQIAIASKAEAGVRPFWRELFAYAEHGDEDLVDLDGRGPSLWFQELEPEKPLRHAFHLDVSVPRAVGRARVEAALRAGGRIAAGSEEGGWWTLADPAGNKVDIAIWADRDGTGE